MGDGKVSILPIDKTGKMNPMELRKMEAEGFKLKPNPLLTPLDDKASGANNTMVDAKQTSISTTNTTVDASGLNGAKNNDMESFVMANKMASA